MSTSNTAGSGAGAGAGGGAGSGIGSKIKGAIQVVHGVGDNIRGTVLGGVDTVAGDTSGAGTADNIATRGRAEVDQGMANLRGGNAASVAQTSPTHTAPSAWTGVVGTGTFGGIGPTGAGRRTGALGHTSGSGARARARAGAGAGVVGAGNQTTQAVPVEQQESAGRGHLTRMGDDADGDGDRISV